MTLIGDHETLGNAYRWRVDAQGNVYEYVARGTYKRRPKLSPRDVDAVTIGTRDVFIPIEGGFALVHDCVLTTKCGHCGAEPGDRCENNGVECNQTHWVRRADARRKK